MMFWTFEILLFLLIGCLLLFLSSCGWSQRSRRAYLAAFLLVSDLECQRDTGDRISSAEDLVCHSQ